MELIHAKKDIALGELVVSSKFYSRCTLLTHSVPILEYYFAFEGVFFSIFVRKEPEELPKRL